MTNILKGSPTHSGGAAGLSAAARHQDQEVDVQHGDDVPLILLLTAGHWHKMIINSFYIRHEPVVDRNSLIGGGRFVAARAFARREEVRTFCFAVSVNVFRAALGANISAVVQVLKSACMAEPVVHIM